MKAIVVLVVMKKPRQTYYSLLGFSSLLCSCSRVRKSGSFFSPKDRLNNQRGKEKKNPIKKKTEFGIRGSILVQKWRRVLKKTIKMVKFKRKKREKKWVSCFTQRQTERDAHIQSKNPFGMLGFDLSSKMTKGCRKKQFRMVMFKTERKWCSFTTQKQSKHVERER